MSETATLLEVLRRHYIKPAADWDGGIFVPECGINGGGRASRADALYVGFTSTSGRLLVGHELKVSRADWRRELDHAGKADFWADACHEWWIVAPGPEVVPAAELPPGWGLLYPGTRARMKTVVKAARKPPEHTPAWDAVRSIMARVDTLHRSALREALSEHRERVEEDVERRLAQRLEHSVRDLLTPEQRRKLSAMDQLEEIFGGPIESWAVTPPEISVQQVTATLRLVQAAHTATGGARRLYPAEMVRESAERLLAGLDAYDAARKELVALLEHGERR